jgi:hypothetical protein
MEDLRTLRQRWEANDENALPPLARTDILASTRLWLSLQETFEPQLRETADLFSRERWAALGELQARLQRLAEWQAKHAEPVHVDSEAATAV